MSGSYHVVVRLGSSIRTFDWEGHPLIIGRDPSCGIRIEDDRVSRRHIRITLLEDAVLVEDLGSANQTRIAGRIIDRAQIVFGTPIILADQIELEVRLKSPTKRRSSRSVWFLRLILLAGIAGMCSLLWLTHPTGTSDLQKLPEQMQQIAVLPNLPPEELFLWAKHQADHGNLMPGATGLAIRAFETVAVSHAEIAAEAAGQAELLRRQLDTRLNQLHYEARRALILGDRQTAKVVAARLRLEAQTYDRDMVQLSDAILGEAGGY